MISDIPKFCLTAKRKREYFHCIPSQAKGRFAIVTNAGRAAVDADGAFDVGARCVRKKRVVLMPQAGIDGNKPGGSAGESTP